MAVDWEHHAQFIVSKFRGIYSRHPEGEPDLRFTIYNPLPDLDTSEKFQQLKDKMQADRK